MIDWLIDWLTDRQTDWLTDWLLWQLLQRAEMNQRKRSFLIRDILADVSIDDFSESSNDELPTTTSFPSGFSDLGNFLIAHKHIRIFLCLVFITVYLLYRKRDTV